MEKIFDVTKTVSFDLDVLADKVLYFVECDMQYDRPEEDDYNALSINQQDDLITKILETALKKYKNT